MLVDSEVFNVGAGSSRGFYEDEVPETHQLRPLARQDHLVTKQTHSKGDYSCCRHRENQYVVMDKENVLFSVREENNWWNTFCCYNLRPCQLRVFNVTSDEVMRINRPFACSMRVFPCQLQRLTVFSPPTELIGTIEQQRTCLRPEYRARDHLGAEILYLTGPHLMMSNVLQNVEFNVMDGRGDPAALVYKVSNGVQGVMFPSMPDMFGLTINAEMGLEHKAILIAMTILLDYMYYD